MAQIRSLICTIVGHVDHGKTSILDRIRGTAVAKGEAGGITQAIGASIIPIEVIKKICGNLLTSLKIKITIPGLLFIDTPGHAAFTNLRKRGGNLADIAIVVIDINEGFKPQTIEAIEILRQYKTPFIIAANKIDMISGWVSDTNTNLVSNISKQSEKVREEFDKKLYTLVSKIFEKFSLNAERFDRVEDYTKQIAIIPTSAVSGEGIPELLMVLTGLAQKFLEECLKCDITGEAKGTVLEVKEEIGLGKTVDAIIYDGHLKIGDTIVIGGLEKPIVAKVKALLQPMPLAEMRDKKTKFLAVKEVFAATGVKISAPDIEEVVAGMPLRSAENDIEKAKEEVQKEVEEVMLETSKEGVVIKADSLGSLEALNKMLVEKGIKVQKASIGNINKKDIGDAESMFEKDPLQAVILGFNVEKESGIKSEKAKIIMGNIIYKIIEELENWQAEEKKKEETRELDLLVRPCKIQVLTGYVFRQSHPAIVGVEILVGKAKVDMPIMKADGKELSKIRSMQAEQENVTTAEKGKQIAMAFDNVTVGRQLFEGDVLYSSIPEGNFRKLKTLTRLLMQDELKVMKEIAEIKRKEDSMWGI
ncbi:MAG: translation initiation factor IF-2 [Candidatus Woesearchaeota archaeon]|nr:translation initiation factor IF-2 [Candidatus Woesearchaeota archaeon]